MVIGQLIPYVPARAPMRSGGVKGAETSTGLSWYPPAFGHQDSGEEAFFDFCARVKIWRFQACGWWDAELVAPGPPEAATSRDTGRCPGPRVNKRLAQDRGFLPYRSTGTLLFGPSGSEQGSLGTRPGPGGRVWRARCMLQERLGANN